MIFLLYNYLIKPKLWVRFFEKRINYYFLLSLIVNPLTRELDMKDINAVGWGRIGIVMMFRMQYIFCSYVNQNYETNSPEDVWCIFHEAISSY